MAVFQENLVYKTGFDLDLALRWFFANLCRSFLPTHDEKLG